MEYLLNLLAGVVDTPTNDFTGEFVDVNTGNEDMGLYIYVCVCTVLVLILFIYVFYLRAKINIMKNENKAETSEK